MAMIYHRIPIHATKVRVFEAITTQEGISQWWTSDCVVKPAVGFVNEFRFGTEAHYRMKVVLLQPGRSVEWKCLNQHDDWSGTQVAFLLNEKGDQTYLDLKHSGFSSENEEFAAINFHWARYLTALKEYCEAGEKQVDQVKVAGTVDLHSVRV